MTKVNMQELPPNKELRTSDAVLEIVMDNGQLPPGQYVFQLVVIDSAGNRSAPALAEVIVVDTEAPTAVLDILPGREIPQGATVTLSGERSVGIREGEEVVYEWTLVRLGR